MAILFALIIFAVLSALCWFVAVAVYRSSVAGHDPAAVPNYDQIAFWAILAATAGCLVPNPAGFVVGLVVWAVAVLGFIAIPPSRRLLLLAYLAVASLFARLIVAGILENMK